MVRRRVVLSLVFLLLPVLTTGQQNKERDVWAPWQFLMGRWAAESNGKPGEGKGTFSFTLELQGKILVRRSNLVYPATGGHAASSHDDLMVIYPESGGAPNRAIYFDNEGHVIHYVATFSEQGKTLTFLGRATPQAARYRLTYRQTEDGLLKVKFEIAPPGKPGVFATYVEGAAYRKEMR
jgi:hypothetical protein